MGGGNGAATTWAAGMGGAQMRAAMLCCACACTAVGPRGQRAAAPSCLPPMLPTIYIQPVLQYLEMIDDVMRNGVFRGDRTGTGALRCAVLCAPASSAFTWICGCLTGAPLSRSVASLSIRSRGQIGISAPAPDPSAPLPGLHPTAPAAGTYSKFGTTMRFNLRHSFPLLTSKRVFWRGEAPVAAAPSQAVAAAARPASRPAWTGPACMALPLAARTVCL